MKTVKIGDAVKALNEGKMVARSVWELGTFIYKQVPAEISTEIIPKMTSVPDSVKERMAETKRPFNYAEMVVTVDSRGNTRGWSPSVVDILAEDWLIL